MDEAMFGQNLTVIEEAAGFRYWQASMRIVREIRVLRWILVGFLASFLLLELFCHSGR